MEERTKKLLHSIIQEYIQTAVPVGSSALVEKYHLDVSPATVRNEMMELEKAGYIYQPHTSAGRMPTEQGYQFYLDNFLLAKQVSVGQQKDLDKLIKKSTDESEQLIKNLAKGLAEMAGQSVVVGFGPQDVYYTGLSNLFAQPEFSESQLVYNMSLVVDHLDEVMNKIFVTVTDQPEIIIGAKNPFGNICASILTKYKLGRREGMIGILGPMRMDYNANLGLVTYARELINSI
ncbi:MAG: hypothetical protein WC480_04845 [Patescibacteria group bacterium]